GFFVGQKVAFPLVKNYIMNTWSKFGVQKVMRDDEGVHYFKFDSPNGVDQVKLYRVPVVAYSEDGLSLIASQVGTPLMLDTFTSTMCEEPWGRIGFARALIEVSAEKDLKENVIMAIPLENGEGYSKEDIRVEYEWKPPTCSDCRVFGHHTEKCPQRPIERAPVVVDTTVEENNDGFVKVGNNQNLRYQPVKPKSGDKKSDDDQQDNGIKLKNLFEKLNDITILVTVSSGGMKLRTYLVIPLKSHNSRKILTVRFPMFSIAAWNIRGLNRTPKQSEVHQVVSENQLSVYAILESHVDVSLLSDVCSWVFKSWEWTSNANLCNLPAERRFLWAELDLHKHVVRGFP
ncbi:hypothetical protein Tco_0928150, partial [Tanacetum coccineum]